MRSAEETASLFTARQARDAGISKTATSNDTWMERAITKLPEMKPNNKWVTGEHIRMWMLTKIEAPKSPHAWGALIRIAMKRGLLRDTGRQEQMIEKKSHARRTPLWELA